MTAGAGAGLLQHYRDSLTLSRERMQNAESHDSSWAADANKTCALKEKKTHSGSLPLFAIVIKRVRHAG